MQIIVEVGIDPASYVNEEYQRRVRAPLGVSELREGTDSGSSWLLLEMGDSLVRLGHPDRGKALLLPALSGDGELSAAVCPALPAGVQPNNRSVFRWRKRPGRRGALAGVAGPLSTRLRELFGRVARGVRGALGPFSAAGGSAQLLGPGNGSLWRPDRRHRQVGS